MTHRTVRHTGPIRADLARLLDRVAAILKRCGATVESALRAAHEREQGR